MKKIGHHVFLKNKKLYTKNLTPGKKVYGEDLISSDRGELRSWNPYRSKLGAALLKKMKKFPFHREDNVLYLGAAQGTTASHISDIVDEGSVVCVEKSPTALEDLIPLCEARPNMLPVLGDARKPGEYAEYCKQVNFIYQDIAQPSQAKIFLKNSAFISPGSWGVLCIKARSVNVAKDPKQVIKKELESVSDGFWVRQMIDLAPFHQDHALALCEKKLS